MVDINNVYPDYEDEKWVSRVTNWEEFWYESEDILDLEDEDVSATDQSMQAINRACECGCLKLGLAVMRSRCLCLSVASRACCTQQCWWE
jgi:hypothetical protein